MLVVEVKPSWEPEAALSGAGVGAAVGPLPEGGLDEAFGFTVGTRPIGFGEAVADVPGLAEATDIAGAVSRSVVGEESARDGAAVGEEAEGSLEKARGGLAPFIGENFDVGQPGVIIDADVGKLPTDASDTRAAISIDTVAWTSDASQLLDVRVKQIARGLVFVASGRLSRFDVSAAGELAATKNSPHR